MAIIEMNLVSHALLRCVPVQVILPADKWNPDGTLMPRRKFKTLYLLHGLWGNCTDWVTCSRLRQWAEKRDLAVVMPSGDNSFYIDRPESNNNYGKFLGEELIEMTRRMLPLSEKREDTFIGGLSMGGFGAMRNGLKYNDVFGAVVSFSGAFHLTHYEAFDPKTRAFGEALFGPMDEAMKSDKNPAVLAKLLAEKVQKPRIYMSCGTEDDLMPPNRAFKKVLEDNGFDVTWHEAPGGHDWDFWNDEMQLVLDWLPLGEGVEGLNSGNVR